MKKVISIVSCLLIALLCFIPHVSAAQEESVDSGYVNVEKYGANGADKNDDAKAFEDALATGKNLYVPKGTYYLSSSLKLSDRILRGSGSGRTTFVGNSADPIIIMEGCSSLYDVTLSYPTKDECWGAAQGEKVALQVGTKEKGLSDGSVVRGIYVTQCGTAIYSPEGTTCNGAIFDNMELAQYTYRAVDMQSDRMMNTYSNCYVTSMNAGVKEAQVDCGFALEGNSYGESLSQINVEHDEYYLAAMSFKNAKGFNVSAIHLEGVNLLTENNGYVRFEKSGGHIANICTLYTFVNKMNNYLFYFADASETGDLVTVGVLHNRGFNQFDAPTHPEWNKYTTDNGLGRGLLSGTPEAADFRLFGRADDAKGNYSLVVDRHSYFSFNSQDVYIYRIYDSAENLDVKIKMD